MSRTYRKREMSFKSYYHIDKSGTFSNDYSNLVPEKEIKKLFYQYHTKTAKYFSYNLPKSFRNHVNRKRRSRDKQAIYDFVYKENEDACFDPWNCKTNNSYDYW